MIRWPAQRGLAGLLLPGRRRSGLVGLGPEMALALARRADILIFVPALPAWPAAEGRRLLARA